MNSRNFAVFGLLSFFMGIAPLSHAYDDETVECRSRDFSFNRCSVPWRSARLVEQLSTTSCIRGETWGIDRRGLWVDGGCAGIFEESVRGRSSGDGRGGRSGSGAGWRPGPGWDTRFYMTCESRDYQYHFCAADVGRGGSVNLEEQISDSKCIEGRTWGWNRAGVWVNGGCAGNFEINRRWR